MKPVSLRKYRIKRNLKRAANKPVKFRIALLYWMAAVIVGLLLRHFVPLS